jgi:hypothetical protein
MGAGVQSRSIENDKGMITKGERTELRSVVRHQFKVLRGEVLQRRAELIAEAEHRIAERFAARDKKRTDVEWRVREIAQAADREIADLVKAAEEDAEGPNLLGRLVGWAGAPAIRWADDSRGEMRRAVHAEIDARVKDAQLRLDRQEADLLQSLALGALESEEARAFLGSIPKVSELVPGDRLAELEAQFAGPDEVT